MPVKVLFFGQLREIAEMDSGDFRNSTELKEYLYERYPLLEDHSFVLALDHQIIKTEQELQDGAEIALLPPFSGG